METAADRNFASLISALSWNKLPSINFLKARAYNLRMTFPSNGELYGSANFRILEKYSLLGRFCFQRKDFRQGDSEFRGLLQ